MEEIKIKNVSDTNQYSLIEGITLIPDLDIPEGKKRTKGKKLFINAKTYSDMKTWLPKAVQWYVDQLEEVEND